MNEDTFLYVSCIQKDGFDLKIGFKRCFKNKFTQKLAAILLIIVNKSRNQFLVITYTDLMQQEFHFNYRKYPSLEALSEQDQLLVAKAIEAMDRAYAPYSKFRVGASVLMESGLIILGNNQENIAYPSGLCAERVALFYAGANHANETIRKICIVATGDLMPKGALLSPCGSCRQVLHETELRQTKPFELILLNKTNNALAFSGVQGLLPFSFTLPK